MPSRPPRSLLLLAALALGACSEPAPDATPADEPLPPVAFDSARVRLVSGADTIPLGVEVATSQQQRAMGLMERDSLPEDRGMIFLFDAEQPADAGFWMFRTRIPLDIAYLDRDGTVLAVLGMEPCTSPEPRWCPSYPPGVPYHATLEVNRGFFARHGVEVGDRVLLPADPAP